MYINDLRNCLNYLTAYYADDTVLVESYIDIYTFHLNLKSDLDNITNWCKYNRLTITINPFIAVSHPVAFVEASE